MKSRIVIQQESKAVFLENGIKETKSRVETTVQMIAHYIITMLVCNGESADYCKQFLENLKKLLPVTNKSREKLLTYCKNVLDIDVESVIEVSKKTYGISKGIKRPSFCSKAEFNRYCDLWYDNVYKIQFSIAIDVTAAVLYTFSKDLEYTPAKCHKAYEDMDVFCRMMVEGKFFNTRYDVNNYIEMVANDYGIILYDEINMCYSKQILPTKAQWYDMIESGEKTEEYRADVPYYNSRFEKYEGQHILVAFRNGYSRKNRTMFREVVPIKRKGGRPEWGGNFDTVYWVLQIVK